MSKQNKTFSLYDDYVQSANTLFHFMKEAEYLYDILRKHAIIPRYCVEDIKYLGIHNNGRAFSKAAILQKCFCDIPFHKLADTFEVAGRGEVYDSLSRDELARLEQSNTHFSYYGEYAIAFSKHWGEAQNLQPIHYLNEDSQYVRDFSALFERILKDPELPDEYSKDVINRLSYIKPLRGIMNRRITRDDSSSADVEIYKNFHDEREWRYVPDPDALSALNTQAIIANPSILRFYKEISNRLESEQYKSLWLNFEYDDIRYIIVPNPHARIELISLIVDLPSDCFENKENIPMQKSIMISKILVLSEIRKDW